MQQALKLCHTHDPETSFDAAERLIRSGELNRQETRVLGAIRMYLSWRKHFEV
jgi:hypothetical protein